MTQPDMKPISKSEQDQVLSAMSQEERVDFGQALQEIKAQAKRSGGTSTKHGLMEARKSDYPEELQKRLDAVMSRNQMGPHEGETPPDFNLKRMGSEPISSRGQ